MNEFNVDLMVTSRVDEFRNVKTHNLEAEGFYGLIRIRIGEKSYGTYIEEVASKLHPQDDLYYWISALLEVLVCISEKEYCAIRDIEYPDRWIEFIGHGSIVEVYVIDAKGSAELIVNNPLLNKKIVVEGGQVDKSQMLREVLAKAKRFIGSVLKIEPRFAETDSHKRIVALVEKAEGIA